MNKHLKQEIILHIFDILGLFSFSFQKGFIEPIKSDKFLLDKKLLFELEDGDKHQRNVWASTSKIDNTHIKIIVADINDGTQEYVLIFQMDIFPPCAMRISKDDDDFGSCFFLIENNKWIEANILMQGKMLVGFESLSEIFSEWHKLDNHDEMYKLVINFLNFDEENNKNSID
jgi:hypothetical protein